MKVIRWPRDFSKTQRVALNTRHQSFVHHRTFAGDDTFSEALVRLKGFLLLVVNAGAALINIDGADLLFGEGDACILSRNFYLTEIPRAGVSYGELDLYFFDETVVSDFIKYHPGLERTALLIPKTSMPAFPLKGAFVRLKGLRVADFQAVLLYLIREYLNPLFFLRQCFFENQIALKRFFSQHPDVKIEDLEDTYPLGAKALRRACRLYLHRTPPQWHKLHTAMHAAADHLKAGKTLAEVVSMPRHKDPRKFVEDYNRVHGELPKPPPGYECIEAYLNPNRPRPSRFYPTGPDGQAIPLWARARPKPSPCPNTSDERR